MNMRQAIIWINLLLLLIASLIVPASASYAGDKPLQTVIHASHPGAVDFTVGDSKYSGELVCNASYTVNFKVEPPNGSTVKYAKAYVYWVWSKNGLEGVYPQYNATIAYAGTATPLLEKKRYTDTKGFASRYDFFSGADAYDLSEEVSGPGTYSVSVVNSAVDGSTFCVQGIGLLLVYEGGNLPEIEYWINEGCDMLYAEYGISPEMATMTTYFYGEIDQEKVEDAVLITVSPSGGYSSDTGARSKLFFNENTKKIPVLGDIIQLLFGSGKSWKNIYVTNETVQVALDKRQVSSYLEPEDNFASVQDSGDYLLATNAILIVEFLQEG